MSNGHLQFSEWPKLTREMWDGDPPPAEPPHRDAKWSPWYEAWMETDESFRGRIRAAVERAEGNATPERKPWPT